MHQGEHFWTSFFIVSVSHMLELQVQMPSTISGSAAALHFSGEAFRKNDPVSLGLGTNAGWPSQEQQQQPSQTNPSARRHGETINSPDSPEFT